MATLDTVAVWLNRKAVYRSVRVETTDAELTVYHRSGRVLNSYPIVEVVQAGRAWDVTYNGTLARIVAAEGCGCGSAPRVTPDPGYSGALNVK